jgi:hypothetical protein
MRISPSASCSGWRLGDGRVCGRIGGRIRCRQLALKPSVRARRALWPFNMSKPDSVAGACGACVAGIRRNDDVAPLLVEVHVRSWRSGGETDMNQLFRRLATARRRQ